MADSTTTNVSLTKPEVGASADTWGTKINTNFDTLDSLFTTGPALLISKGGTSSTTASGARTALGLGTVAVEDTVPVAKGGTGSTTLTANNVLLGNGTSALQAVAPSTSGNVLTSNGTTWVSSSLSGGFTGQVFTSSGTFTIPTGVTAVKVTVCGAQGGGGGRNTLSGVAVGGQGAVGGEAVKYLTGLTPSNTLVVTVGAGGAGGANTSTNYTTAATGSTGGTSSVASGTQTITTISATGGSGGGGGFANTDPELSGASSAGAVGTSGIGSNGDINSRQNGAYSATTGLSSNGLGATSGSSTTGGSGLVIFEW